MCSCEKFYMSRIISSLQFFFHNSEFERPKIARCKPVRCFCLSIAALKQEFVRPRWPYDMRPSVRAEKYMCVIVIR